MFAEKRCSTCGEIKPLDLFHRKARSADGRQPRCKVCACQMARDWVAANRERKREADRQYRVKSGEILRAKKRAYGAAHAEEARARAREWGRENRERARAAAREYYQAHPDEVKARARAWRQANPERKRFNDKRFRAENKERVKEYGRRYRERTKGDPERKQRHNAMMKRRRAGFRASIFERDKGICGLCGLPVNPAAFHIDHVIPVSLGGEHTVENMQLAHPRCNRSKGGRLS